MPEAWKVAVDDLDLELNVLQHTVYNSFWPAVAAVALMIDKGIITSDDAIEIIDAVHDVAAAHVEPGYGEGALLVLEQMRKAIAELEFSRGEVLRKLRTQLAAEMVAALLRLRQRRNRGSLPGAE